MTIEKPSWWPEPGPCPKCGETVRRPGWDHYSSAVPWDSDGSDGVRGEPYWTCQR